MEKNVKAFLDKIYNSRKAGCTYTTFGFEADYKKMENVDYGYIPFLNGLGFEELECIIPATNPNNRCGIIREKTNYIVVHDTAGGSPTSTAKAHDKWLMSMATNPDSTYAVSWHFTVDEDTIIQHLPLNEVGYHAGDGTRVKLEFADTKIPYNKDGTKITIDEEGYFLINDENTNILAPKTDEGNIVNSNRLPTLGVHYIVGENGNYFLGNTYWNTGYKILSNRGGNLTSIGIETCVNSGSDYLKTMRITAYLVAKLLIEYNLDIKAVKQHNDFSGKDCPMTIRHANKWEEFLGLVELNLEYLRYYKDLNIEFISLTKDLLDDSGKIIKHVSNEIVKYKVVVGNEEYLYEVKPDA